MFEIREEFSLEGFVASWEECMKGAPWFDSDIIFWYEPEEELDRIRSIHKNNGLFLVASRGSDPEPLGVISVQVLGGLGKIAPENRESPKLEGEVASGRPSFEEHARNSGTGEPRRWSSPSDIPATTLPGPPG